MDEPALSSKDAREALETIRAVERQTRRAVGMGGGGPIITVWGLVWMVGFLGSHFLDGPIEGALWLVVDVAGIAATLAIVARGARKVRDPMGARIGWLWLAVFVYAGVLIGLTRPADYDLVGLLLVLTMMFGYVIMGIFVDRTFLWLGIGVSALAIVGYLVIADAFGLWMGLLGGGTLVGSGVYIMRRWR